MRWRWTLMVAASLVPVAARATILADWSLDDVLARSDGVILGVVIEQRAHPGEIPLTESVVQVERVLRGAPLERLSVYQYGGQIGDVVVRIPGDPRLAVGQRVVLFTRRARDRRDYLVGMGLGVYEVVGERLRQWIDVPVLGADGRLRAPPAERWLSFEELEAALERAP